VTAIDSRKERIAKAFSLRADAYDFAADVQWLIAARLAERIEPADFTYRPRILEIGCGTGFLSARLMKAFPAGEMVLTDIVPSMLDRCRERVGNGPRYRVLDGERPLGLTGSFDLIVSSLAFQWFVDLEAGLDRLRDLLAPNGRMLFATLGCKTFVEWRDAHAAVGLDCGTPNYPSMESFPWPKGWKNRLDEELVRQPYSNGHDFVKSLKALGAGEPALGHRPLSTGAFRRLLASLEGGFTATYHVLYGETRR
jgi:malonyl-CoA O-methyltransferase